MNQITKIGVVRVTLERKNSKKPFSPEKAVRLYSRMSDTTQRPENWLFQIIPFPSGCLCGRLRGLVVFLAGCSPFDLLVKTFMVAGLLVAVAAIRIKHNPTAINRRQADQGLTTFERDKQAT